MRIAPIAPFLVEHDRYYRAAAETRALFNPKLTDIVPQRLYEAEADSGYEICVKVRFHEKVAIRQSVSEPQILRIR